MIQVSHLILAQDMVVGDVVTDRSWEGKRTVASLRIKSVETDDEEFSFVKTSMIAEDGQRHCREFDPHHLLTKHEDPSPKWA